MPSWFALVTPSDEPASLQPRSSLGEVAGAVTLLVFLGLVLPVPIERADDGLTSEDCVTLGESGAASTAPLAVLERCSAMLDTDTDLLAALAAAREAAGDLTKAEATYVEALQLDPGLADVHVQLARLMLHRGAPREARAHAEAALAIQPNRRVVLALLDEVARSEPRP